MRMSGQASIYSLCTTATLLMIAGVGVPSGVGALRAQPTIELQKSPDIIVNGSSDAAMSNFLEHVIPSRHGRQPARWDGNVCPLVEGLEADHARLIISRLEDVSKQLGLRVSDGKHCSANLIITFTLNPDEVAEKILAIYQKHSDPADGNPRTDKGDDLLKPLPVRLFSLDSLSRLDGRPLTWAEPSRLRNQKEQKTQFVYLIVDARKLGAVNFGSLTDYLVMASLTQPRMGVDYKADPTILSIFDRQTDDASAVDCLTEQDWIVLRSLYQGDASVDAGQRRKRLQIDLSRHP